MQFRGQLEWRRLLWLAVLVLTLLFGLLRASVGSAQETDQPAEQEPVPYTFVFGNASQTPTGEGLNLEASQPASSEPPPLFIGWVQDASDLWRDMPLWSQAALVSAVVATVSIVTVRFVRWLAETILEGFVGS